MGRSFADFDFNLDWSGAGLILILTWIAVSPAIACKATRAPADSLVAPCLHSLIYKGTS